MISRFLPIMVLLLAAVFGKAQTNIVVAPARTGEAMPAGSASASRAEQIRTACLQGRRFICGRILKVLPDGFVVESGYTSLLRPPLDQSWLVPGTVPASRDSRLVEAREPDSICAGLVFLTDIPRTRGVEAKPYDYVVLHAYPAGLYTYTSAGSIQRTVRRFSCGPETAVRLSTDAGEKPNAGPAAVVSSAPH